MHLLAISTFMLPLASAGVAIEGVIAGGKSSSVTSSASSSSSIASTPSSSSTASPIPVNFNCTDTSRTSSPSCWDTLGMDLWMFNWYSTTTTCSPDEIWSDCFLRLAFEAPGYDCSTIGSIFCSAVQLGQTPSEAHAFYAAYNIYAVWRYFSNWQTALYAFKSQQAINRLVSILNVPGAPKLTINSLLVAIIGNYGLDPAVDEAFISILPSGPKAEPLNTNQQYMSTQLAGLLGDILKALSTDFHNGYFLFLVRHGQMMTDTSESLQNLEANLAGTYQKPTSSIQPISS